MKALPVKPVIPPVVVENVVEITKEEEKPTIEMTEIVVKEESPTKSYQEGDYQVKNDVLNIFDMKKYELNFSVFI